jgi:hypothetical protein
MAVRCIFFTPNSENGCQVLRLAGASPCVKQTKTQLEKRYCMTGRFISCPLFIKVERGLIEANRCRTAAASSLEQSSELQVAS